MSYEFYKVLHILGVIFLLAALGGMAVFGLLDGNAERGRLKRTLAIMHGLALLIVLVAGFGLLARLGFMGTWPAWVWGKLGIWLALGAALTALKRKPGWSGVLLWVLPLLASLAAYLAVNKPA